MNILYIAYSCLPNKGSEEKIGWSIPLESAKHNKVFVVTKEEHRATIEKYLSENKIENIKFYYVDINGIYKKLFKGIMYSIRLNIWHKNAYPIVKDICEKENIDIIHQITPIEFRSIGKYENIENTRFVCGPLGGGEFLPKGLSSYAKGNMLVEYAREFLNKRCKRKYMHSKMLNRCDYVLFANKETESYLADLVENVPHKLFFDNGIGEADISEKEKTNKNNDKFIMLVAGRLAYRKGHSFLFDVLKTLPQDFDYECRVIGTGPLENKLKDKAKACNLNDKVVFTGRIPFEAMAEEYENADVFVMPSIRETTGAVLLEAMSKGLPIVTINKFGGPVLFDNSLCYLYDGETLEDYKKSLREKILECANNRDELLKRGVRLKEVARENIWSKKIEFYNSVYAQVMEK